MIPRQKLLVTVAIFGLVGFYEGQARTSSASHTNSTKREGYNFEVELEECLKHGSGPLMENPVCGFDKKKKIKTTFGSMREFEQASSRNENLVFKKADYCSERHRVKHCIDKFEDPESLEKTIFCAETPGFPDSQWSGFETTYEDKICRRKPSWKILHDRPCIDFAEDQDVSSD